MSNSEVQVSPPPPQEVKKIESFWPPLPPPPPPSDPPIGKLEPSWPPANAPPLPPSEPPIGKLEPSWPPANAPPPPPPLLPSRRFKRANSKLKSSSQISSLYRVFKRRFEGNDQIRSNYKRILCDATNKGNTKGAMAAALEEMTKRSAYFQNIAEDAKRFAAPITEMKTAINEFETKNMDELVRFQRYVDIHLENLTDESQVLARFEDFPSKKLEAIRGAANLYTKLNSIVEQLKTWQFDPPLSRQLEKITCYFDKIKGELENLERTKDDEAKRYRNQRIFFDFDIIIRIKEAAVDVSSKCISLALEASAATKASVADRGDGKLKINDDRELRKCFHLLWKTFQLTYRIYSFAGGHDDRAEELSCALAKEMETYPEDFWSL